MAEISIPEEEFGEPSLNYWKPVPKPPTVSSSPFTPNGYDHLGWPHQVPPTYNQSTLLPHSYLYHQGSYPLTDVIHSYIQNQQIGLLPGYPTFEGERRRLPQCSLVGADHVLYTLSANPNFEQDNQTMTDNMIQDEVTRAAKTLFSKRNRTLLHWLNPDINKNQIKIDVNAAWDSLPAAEKVFYISQVLGKFSPHVTSLMVNPQLEPSTTESPNVKRLCIDKDCDKLPTSVSGNKARRKSNKTQAKKKHNVNFQAVKTEDEESCDSGLAVDSSRMAKVEKPIEVCPAVEKQKVKRKYTKRKRNDGIERSNSCPLPVDVKDIKAEPSDELPVDVKHIKVEPCDELPVDVKNIKVEPNYELPVDVKDIKVESNSDIPNSIKVEPNTKVDNNPSNPLPKPKRKYVKRKLVRKKYKRREPKQKPPISTPTEPTEKVKIEENVPDGEEIEMDLWIELGNDSILTNEEVDIFFDSIEDPDSLFRELGIIEN